MGKKSLVALDTDHIKQYVFATDKLKEIRGASSLLDLLNRTKMTNLDEDEKLEFKVETVYAHGGSGLFLVDADKQEAEKFGKLIQKKYREETQNGASITFAVQEIPESIKDVWNDDIWNTLELLRYSLREKKGCLQEAIALPSHPFMRSCDSCGLQYAERADTTRERDPDERDARYCASCMKKRERDIKVKGFITHEERTSEDHLWTNLLKFLREPGAKYDLPENVDRPHDFNVFRNFKGAKDYLGLIYADANGMGQKIEACRKLKELQELAKSVDDAIYQSVCFAITKWLKIKDHIKSRNDLKTPVFPFDILLIGGDDVVMVTPASVALDVALTIAQKFHEEMQQQHTLSVGVVLAPIKYPFGLQLDLVEDTLKKAKKAGFMGRTKEGQPMYDTRINFLVVTGGTSQSFEKVYASLHTIREVGDSSDARTEFYATLRPYNLEELSLLLDSIRKGSQQKLGRTKLHQLREAILKLNSTTAVVEGMALLRNWSDTQRDYVVGRLREFGKCYQAKYGNPQSPASNLPRTSFPWFADGKDIYRTCLLDFVELYDFIGGEEDDDHDKA